jgi:Na+-driven multidrug efflux pump
LIDTSVVGVNPTSTIAELAALGPGIAFIDSSSYLFQFMGMATTNLYANALSEGNRKKSEQVLSRSVITAFFFGLALMAAQFGLAERAIKALSGTAVESIPFGIQYAKIRAFAAPVALPTIVAQAAFLAAKDAVTPLKATAIGAVANLLGDILLVTVLKQGVAGAALATAVSQYVGAIYLLVVAVQKVGQNGKDKGLGLGATLNAVRQKIYVPSAKDMISYLQFCGPLFAVLLIKTFLWSYTTFACAAAGAIQLAAHQITINLFLFFCIFGDVVSQLSQTYLPYFLNARKDPATATATATPDGEGSVSDTSIANKPQVLQLVRRVTTLALSIGILNSIGCQALKRWGNKCFTNSAEVISTMGSVSNLLSIATVCHACVIGIEGILLAFRDFRFLSLMYSIIGVVFIGYQTFVRQMCWGIQGVWWGTVAYQYTRIALVGLRLRHILQRPDASVDLEIAADST